jgi:hypothetical protein
MKYLTNKIAGLILFIAISPFIIWVGTGLYSINTELQNNYDFDFLSANEFSIPVGQIVSYMFFSTIFFLLRRFKLGLMTSFAYVFNWGFIHASANFVDMMGKPTPGLLIYLASGLMLATLAVVGFFIEEE